MERNNEIKLVWVKCRRTYSWMLHRRLVGGIEVVEVEVEGGMEVAY